MQPGTEDMGPEDLTGITRVMWHESFRPADLTRNECATRGEHVRDALARCRAAALESLAQKRMRFGEVLR